MEQGTDAQPLDTLLLADLVGRKFNCLAQLFALGRQQTELIGAGDMSQLLNVLAAKQRLLADLQQLERRLDPFRGQSADQRQWPGEAQRQQCADQIARSEQLFRAILAQEQQAEDALRERRDQTAERLHTAHSATQARSAYSSNFLPSCGQLDLSTER